MLRYGFIIIALLFNTVLMAQQVHWAHKVLDYSSHYADAKRFISEDYYAASQVLGVPNAYSGGEANSTWAWVSKKESSKTSEYISVAFKKPVRNVQQVIISESLNPGAIYRIYLIDQRGKKHKVFENKNIKAKLVAGMPKHRMFRHFVSTDYAVKGLKLELKTDEVPGSNQIDAIGVVTSRKNVNIRRLINNLEYQERIQPAEKLSRSVNSNFAERLPVISPDGQTLYFARKYHPQNIGADKKDDIWVSKMTPSGQWSKAKNIGTPLNDEGHNFIFGTNATGSLVYLSGNYRGLGGNGIATAKQSRGQWKKPRDQKIANHFNDDVFISYTMSVDGRFLLMSVERDDSYGDRDFYVSSLKKDGSWSEPENMGEDINTVGAENSIFLAADGRTIYFSSNGHYNYGGFDMYKSTRLDESWTKWSKPENLGPQINTKFNDFNYTLTASGDYAYFSKDEAGGNYTYSNIYRIKLPKEARPETMLLVDNQEDSDDGEELDYDEAAITQVDDDKIQRLKDKLNRIDSELRRIEREDERSTDRPVQEGGFASRPSDQGHEDIADNEPMEEDDELARLRNKFKKKKRKPRQSPRPKPQDDDEFEEEIAARGSDNEPLEEDEELARLRNKFKKKKKTTKPKTKPKPKPTIEEEPDEPVRNEPIEEDEEEDDIDFDALKEEVRRELQDELRDKVERDLKKELTKEVEDDLASELDPDVRRKLRQQLEKDIKAELRKELRPQIEKELRAELRGEIEKELRDELKAKIRKDLEKELRDEVKDKLRNEYAYKVKAELEKKIREELEEKMKQEIADEPLDGPMDKPAEEDEVLVVPLKVGQIIPLNNIFFDSNKSSLKDNSYSELDKAIDFLRENSNLVIEVGGHTNGWCSHSFANELSGDRSEAVAKYFIKNGIPARRIKFHGYGKKNPIAPNNTVAGRKKNQRVELKILEILEE